MKAVIFDINGTIVFDSPYHDDAWAKMMIELRGYPLNEDEYLWSHGKTNVKIIKYLFPNYSDEEIDALSKRKEALYREIATKDKDYKLVDGYTDYLKYLISKNILINVASASIKDNMDFYISYFHLGDYMDANKICYDDGTYEDKIAMYKDAAKKIGVDMKDVIIFEDSITGVNCAKEAGAGKIIAITEKGVTCPVNAKDVEFIIEDYKDPRIYELF